MEARTRYKIPSGYRFGLGGYQTAVLLKRIAVNDVNIVLTAKIPRQSR